MREEEKGRRKESGKESRRGKGKEDKERKEKEGDRKEEGGRKRRLVTTLSRAARRSCFIDGFMQSGGVLGA